MGWEFSDVVIFDLGPFLQGQTRIDKLKIAYNSLIIGPRESFRHLIPEYKIYRRHSFDEVLFLGGIVSGRHFCSGHFSLFFSSPTRLGKLIMSSSYPNCNVIY